MSQQQCVYLLAIPSQESSSCWQGKTPDPKNISSGKSEERLEKLGKQHRALTAALTLAQKTLASKRQSGLSAFATERAENSIANMKKAIVENEQQVAWLHASDTNSSYKWQVDSSSLHLWADESVMPYKLARNSV